MKGSADGSFFTPTAESSCTRLDKPISWISIGGIRSILVRVQFLALAAVSHHLSGGAQIRSLRKTRRGSKVRGQLNGGASSPSAVEGSASLRNPGAVSPANRSGLDHLLQRQMLLLSARHFRRRLRPAGNAHQAREGAEQRQVLQHVEFHWRTAASSGIAPNP